MKQAMTGFRLDHENHWVAELACGHSQHVRHDPPWMVREWVTTEDGRKSRIGQHLNCVRCDELALKVIAFTRAHLEKRLLEDYEQAGISGLCGEGRVDVLFDSLRSFEIQNILDKLNDDSD